METLMLFDGLSLSFLFPCRVVTGRLPTKALNLHAVVYRGVLDHNAMCEFVSQPERNKSLNIIGWYSLSNTSDTCRTYKHADQRRVNV